jgi:hypothetical protein
MMTTIHCLKKISMIQVTCMNNSLKSIKISMMKNYQKMWNLLSTINGMHENMLITTVTDA